MTDSVTTDRLDMLPLRMLGENMLLRRYQWEELVDEMHPKSVLRGRIQMMLEAPARRKCAYAFELKKCTICQSESNCYR